MNKYYYYLKILSLKNNPTIKNGVLFSFFSFLNSGMNFLLLIIIAKFISPEGYGKLNIFNTTTMLLGFLIHLNTQGIISINFFKRSRTYFSKTINTVFLITLSCLFIYGGIFYILEEYLIAYLNISKFILYIALFICFFQTFNNINLDLWRLEEKPISYGLYSFGYVIANFILTIFLIVQLNSGWIGRVYAQLITTILFFIFAIFFMVKRRYLRPLLPVREHVKEALSFGIPLIPHTTSFWLRQGLDRYIINSSYSASVVGLFSFSYNFANIIQIIGSAFNATNSVFIYKSLSKHDNVEDIRTKLKKQTKSMILFYTIITILICILSSLFISIFFPQYIESLEFIIPQCLGAMCQCFYLLFVNFLFYYKKTKILMYITFGFSLFHVVLSLLLTKYSVFYTAYIGLLSNLLIALGVYLYSRKIYRLF